jgi:hypothetical protein
MVDTPPTRVAMITHETWAEERARPATEKSEPVFTVLEVRITRKENSTKDAVNTAQ